MQDFTSGSILRHLVNKTGLMLTSLVAQTMYVLVDLYWVSGLGTAAVAAVAISANLGFVVLALHRMIHVGTTTLVARAVGRNDRPRALTVFNQSQSLSLLVGSAFLVVALAARHRYIAAFTSDPHTRQLASEYLLWFIPTLAIQFAPVPMLAALRGSGNFRKVVLVQVTTLLLAVVLAPMLIFGRGTGHPFGVAGAAIATLIGAVFGTVWLVKYLCSSDTFLAFERAKLRPNLKVWRELLEIGAPASAEVVLTVVNMFVVFAVTRPFGAAAQAAFGIAQRLIQGGFMPVVALGFAIVPVAAQNVSAGHADRVRQTFQNGVTLAVVMMLVLFAGAQLAPEALMRLFSSDTTVIGVGGGYLRIISWSFVASGITYVTSSMFQALGKTVSSLVAAAARLAVTASLLALSMAPAFSLSWTWSVLAAGIVLQTVASAILLRRQFRARLAVAPAAIASVSAIMAAPNHPAR